MPRVQVAWIDFSGNLVSSPFAEGSLEAGLLSALGHHFRLWLPGAKTQPELLISHVGTRKQISIARSLRIPTQRRVLFLFEPPSVIYGAFRQSYFNHFGLFLAASPVVGELLGIPSVLWPQPDRVEKTVAPLDLRNREIVMIQANKLSAAKGELYSFRRECLGAAAQAGWKVRVYGQGWERGTASSVARFGREILRCTANRQAVTLAGVRQLRPREIDYQGVAASKELALSNSLYSLVVENSRFFVTEKLFDAVWAGTIPLYAGPDLEMFGLPEGIALHIGDEPESFFANLHNLTLKDLAAVRQCGQDFVSSERYSDWSARSVGHRFSLLISEYLEEQASRALQEGETSP